MRSRGDKSKPVARFDATGRSKGCARENEAVEDAPVILARVCAKMEWNTGCKEASRNVFTHPVAVP